MKNSFAVNSDNQLLFRTSSAKTPTPIGGHFSVEDNQLVYYINESDSWRREYNLPSKMRFSGRWELNSNYDLELILTESETQYAGERLIIHGRIISVENNYLVFEAITKKLEPSLEDEPGLYSFQLIKLLGTWQADENNQLTFLVKKDTVSDVLTLQGAWQINQNQKIAYSYERRDFASGLKSSEKLEFDGFWEIGESDKLRYILSGSSISYFDFRLQLESKNLYPAKGIIKYRIGIGLKAMERPKEKIISLFGTWKFSRALGLLFEMDYGEGSLHALEFGAEVVLSSKDKFTFRLKNQHNQPLGLSLTFTHKFLKSHDAEVFIRLEELIGKEGRAEVRAHIPF
ncbi:MAG: hypothetical protein NTW64_00630 [Candidatus Omnitrophica bacterium]|nr:hypothetical protein [Candidatus Omnitrophota bacterium]